MGGGGGARSAPFSVAMRSERRVRAAHGRAREAKPTSLSYIHLGSSVCHPVVLSYSCHSCGTLSYSLCFSDQTDQGNETEGLEMEGL
jgi:hypothetical protein